MLAHQDQTVREGRFRLLIPSRRQHRELPVGLQPLGEQNNQRKQSQQAGCCAGNRQVAPLGFRFQTKMRARFLKGRFNRPAHHDPLDDLGGRGVELRAGEHFVAQVTIRVARDDITDRHGGFARCVPQRGARKELQLLLAPPPRVPDLRRLPGLLRTAQHRQKRQSPDPAAPRQLDQQHQGEPFQAETFDHIFATRPHRIAITPHALDCFAAPPLNRVIRADHHDATGRQPEPQQAAQNPAQALQRARWSTR